MIDTLGKLIEALEKQPQDNWVFYSFGYFKPTTFGSFRARYEDLALGYTEKVGHIAVKELLERCKDANGKTFEGYRGGEFTMHLDTPLWIANDGDNPKTAIERLSDEKYMTVIHTKFQDY